ncbi:MAG: DsbA family protein [Proteobacteria bacterium]|nr:DsbA family protein [Pseudomonadota bacterium]MBI3495874.1 DsbA family protein [Pseudomonadota bacterium]
MLQVHAYTIYHSPNAYIGSVLLRRALAERPTVQLVRRPFLIPRERGLLVADLVGGRETPAMGSYHREDAARWAKRHAIPLVYPPPGTLLQRAQHWAKTDWQREELPARAYYAARESGREHALDQALFEAAWVEGMDVNLPETIAWAAERAGLEGDRLLAEAMREVPGREVWAALEEFDRLQCPGVPTFVLDGARYFGKDRVDWLVAAIEERA